MVGLGRGEKHRTGCWDEFEGEKENGTMPGLLIENTFLFSNLFPI
jgi:hypothetical protein